MKTETLKELRKVFPDILEKDFDVNYYPMTGDKTIFIDYEFIKKYLKIK